MYPKLSLCSLLFILTGCATQTGLLSPGVERVCSDRICWIRADASLVNTRCTDRKAAWKICKDNPNRIECARTVAYWDSGVKQGEGEPQRARCCTILRPKDQQGDLRYWIWMSYGDEDCAAHELGHVEVYEQDGRKFIQEHHKRLHEYGLGRPKKRL